MTHKTKVKFIMNNRHGFGKEGDVGYIDGYCRESNDRPYCVVIVGKNIYFALPYILEVISEEEFLSLRPLIIENK